MGMKDLIKARAERIVLATHTTVTDKCENCGHKHSAPVTSCACYSDWCPCNPNAERV